MLSSVFESQTEIEAPVSELWDWHFRDGAFSRLTPPWEPAEVIESFSELTDGARATIELKIGPLRPKWVAEHELTNDGFVDRQIRGPFTSWEHHHQFESIGDSRSRLIDSIRYQLPLAVFSRFLAGPFVRRKLERMFRYRHEVTRLDLERRISAGAPEPLTILMTGSSGMIGRALTGFLQTQGHRVFGVSRTPRGDNEFAWDPSKGSFSLPDSLPIDAVIHLAGENVAEGRWSISKKRSIEESRREGTRLLVETLLARAQKPTVVVSASGSGYYPLSEGPHDESSENGKHFLAQVCRDWEAETKPLLESGIRVVTPRIGVVLSPEGGALQRLLPLFQLGLGGPIGDGSQHLSWIALDDCIDLLHRFVIEPSWEGPVNLVAPDPISNRDFSRTLANILKRPCLFATPRTLIEAVFGEMARETILADVKVIPGKLIKRDYPFRYPGLTEALSHSIGVPPRER